LWGARVNLEAGTWYLGRALGRWRGRGDVGVVMGLAEYNAGLGNALRWVPREGAGVEEAVGGITWPGVRDYVREVMESWRMYRERGGV
jgi:soluble lytic murein transglycosylase-like protein